MRTTLLLDADDTLWENISVFNAINAAYVEWLLPNTTLEEVQGELDDLQEQFITQHGYGRDTFVLSLTEGIRYFTGRVATEPDHRFVAELTRPLQWDDLELIDGVEETLEQLHSQNRLIMVTKGDHDEQSHKVSQSGLGHFFDAIEILPTKSVDLYRDLTQSYALDPDMTWMIGNSPRSDINPALEAGLGAVHVPHSETWSHEDAPLGAHPRLMTLRSFTELVKHF